MIAIAMAVQHMQYYEVFHRERVRVPTSGYEEHKKKFVVSQNLMLCESVECQA